MRSATRLAGVVAFAALTGCSMTATMVPVRGPLSQDTPVPVIQVKVKGIWGNSGELSFDLPGGEHCKGRWSSAAGASVTVSSGSLISQYGSTYLSGVSTSSGTGQNPGAALAVCDSGRTVDVEFVTGAGTAHGFGIAKDNRDNIYRLVF